MFQAQKPNQHKLKKMSKLHQALLRFDEMTLSSKGFIKWHLSLNVCITVIVKSSTIKYSTF